MGNPKFEKMKSLHPNWSDEQIWTAISLDMEANNAIDLNPDIKSDDPEILKLIIEGAKKWLEAVLPIVFEKVKEFFNDALQHIGEWIDKGIKTLMEWVTTKLPQLINKLS